MLLPLDLRKRKFKYSSPMFVFNQHCLILFCFFLANKVIFSILFFPLLLQNTSSHTHTHFHCPPYITQPTPPTTIIITAISQFFILLFLLVFMHFSTLPLPAKRIFVIGIFFSSISQYFQWYFLKICILFQFASIL